MASLAPCCCGPPGAAWQRVRARVLVNTCMCMYVCMYVSMDRWMGGWMGGWMDLCMCTPIMHATCQNKSCQPSSSGGGSLS